MGTNRGIGVNNKLPWGRTMPADMKFFIKTTTGKPIIMGRNTFDDIKKALPNRRNIVITRDKSFYADNVEVVHSIDEAIELTKDEPEVMVIGGGEIYKQMIGVAHRLYITHINLDIVDADAFFPEISNKHWLEVSSQEFKKDESNFYDYAFKTYDKAK